MNPQDPIVQVIVFAVTFWLVVGALSTWHQRKAKAAKVPRIIRTHAVSDEEYTRAFQQRIASNDPSLVVDVRIERKGGPGDAGVGAFVMFSAFISEDSVLMQMDGWAP